MLRKALDGLYLAAGWLAGLFLIAILLLMLALSAGRPLNINIPAGDEFVGWCMAAMAFLGLAHTFKSGEMIRVGLLIDRFSGRTRRVLELVSLSVGTFFVVYFAWHAVGMTIDSWRFNDTAQGVVPVQLWIPQLGYTSGLVILAIAFLDELHHVARGKAPRYEKPPPVSNDEVIERAMQSGV